MTDRLNELLYKKSIIERKTSYNEINRKDKKFYRKRILNLTRELFFSSDAGNSDVNDAFMNYVYYCVAHFKQTDTNDILQGEYMGLNDGVCGYTDADAEGEDMDADGYGDMDGDMDGDENLDLNAEQHDEHCMSSYNSSMMRKIVKPNTLDNFIIRNVIKKNEAEHLPIQKEINLKDPQLRVKGIVKKKNLMNTYEEEENTQKKEPEPEPEPEQSEENHATVNASVTASVTSSVTAPV